MGDSGIAAPDPAGRSQLPRIAVHDAAAADLVERLGDVTEFPLRILQAPRGYGKTALAVTWLRTHRGRLDQHFIGLTPTANDPAGFWQELLEGLERTMPDQAPLPQCDAGERAAHLLRAVGHPMLVVVDDYHEAGLRAGANEIDAALVDFLRQNDQLYIMLCGRRPRALDSLGPLSVDSCLIGPDDLRMTSTMTFDLAASMGLALDRPAAGRLTAALDGWPALIRAAILQAVTAGASGIPPEDLVRPYVAAMLQEASSTGRRDFILATAVPDGFDLATARALSTGEDALLLVNDLVASGLLNATATGSGSHFSYAPAVRRTLLALMSESGTGVETQTYRTLMARAAAEDDPLTALGYATRSQDWPAALEVIEASWDRLLLEAPGVLGTASRALPSAKVALDARLRLARDHLRHESVQPHHGRDTYEPGRLCARLHASVIARRGSNVRDDDLLALLQWGISLLASGDLLAATYAFAQAHAWGTAHHDDGAALAAIGAALAHALRGEPALASPWLVDTGLAAWRRSLDHEDPPDALLLTLESARALVRVDSDDPDALASAMALADDPRRDDLSSLCEFVRALAALQRGDLPAMLARATSARAALDAARRGSMVETLLTVTLVDLLLACDMPASAQEVLQLAEPRRDLWIASAKIHLTAADHDAAVADIEHLLADPAALGRFTLDAHLLAARAHYGAGRINDAQSEFRTAADIALLHGRTAPFALVPQGQFLTLARNDPSLQVLRPDLYRADRGPGSRVVVLTPREAQILQALQEHSGPVGISRSLGLSPNTVKTHVRAIYRKLGVTTRAEAIHETGRVRVST